MSIYRHVRTLLTHLPGDTTAQIGPVYAVLPLDGDQQSDAQQSWHVFFDASQSGGATLPTTDVLLETSHDGQSWVLISSLTTLTADGSLSEFKAIQAVGPFVRARTLVSGATPPTHTAVVKLASDGPFRLIGAP